MIRRVEAENGSYDIHIGSGLLNEDIVNGEYAVVTDSNVAGLYAERFDADRMIVLEAGEQSKNLENLGNILDRLLKMGLERGGIVVALGGGVVGDIAGFAASVYRRGTGLVQVPTTLLSMVDSSVGGKTAINLKEGKNMAGTFYQPQKVVIDTDTLKTLDERQKAAGMAEVIKYAYIADAGLYLKLRENNFDTAGMIADCCSIKADYVKKDPYDKGVRMQLNYGHTIGHAIEAAAGYGNYLHGEAVAMGMVCAAKIGEKLGVSPRGLAQDTAMLVEKYGLRYEADVYVMKNAVELLANDKKSERGEISFILIDSIGHAVVKKIETKLLANLITEDIC